MCFLVTTFLDTHIRAPLADLGVFYAVDGAVFRLGEGGGEGGAVGVAGGGVDGEELPAGAAIHLDLTLVEVFAVAFPAPADLDFVAVDGVGGVAGSAFFTANNAEVAAHSVRACVVFFERSNQVAQEAILQDVNTGKCVPHMKQECRSGEENRKPASR